MKLSSLSPSVLAGAVVFQASYSGALTDPICNVLGDNPVLLEFPSLKVPCPEVGKRVNVAYSFRKTMREISQDSMDITKSGIAMTVSHDGSNPVAGISYGYTITDLESPEDFDCTDLKYNLTDFVFGITHTDDRLTFCSKHNGGALSDEGGFCGSAGLGDAGTPEKTVVLSAWNDGGCEGEMEVKAVLRDALTEDFGVPPSNCLSPIVPICQVFNNGTGGEPYVPAEDDSGSADIKTTMWLGIGLGLLAFAVGN